MIKKFDHELRRRDREEKFKSESLKKLFIQKWVLVTATSVSLLWSWHRSRFNLSSMRAQFSYFRAEFPQLGHSQHFFLVGRFFSCFMRHFNSCLINYVKTYWNAKELREREYFRRMSTVKQWLQWRSRVDAKIAWLSSPFTWLLFICFNAKKKSKNADRPWVYPKR